MADKKAKIEIGIDGVNEVVEGFQKVLSSATFLGLGLATIVAGVKQLNDEFRKLKGIHEDVSLLESSKKRIEFRDSVDLINRRSGGQLPISYLNSKLSNVSLATGFKPDDIGKTALDLGDATGRYKEAAEATEFVAKHAKNLGITLQEAGVGAKTFVNVLKVPEKELGNFYTQLSESAKKAGISPLLIERQIVQNADNLKGYSFKTTEDRQAALDLQVQFNKRANPQQAADEYGKALGITKGSQQQIQRYEFNHGKEFDLFDEDGNIKLGSLGRLVGHIRKKAKGNKEIEESTLAGVIGDRHAAKTLLGIDYSKLGQEGKAEYPPEPFTAVESPTVQAEKVERAEELYDREKGKLTTLFGERGARAQEKLDLLASERRKKLSNLSPEEQKKFIEKERFRNFSYNPASYGRAVGDYLDLAIPGSRKFLLGTTAKEQDDAPEVKHTGGDAAILEGIHGTLKSIDEKLSPKDDHSHTRTPSTGAQ